MATARLLRDASTLGIERPALQLRADTGNAGIGAARAAVELAFAFHHAVTDDQHGTDNVLARLRELTASGDHRYYLDISRSMTGRPADPATSTRWLDSEQAVSGRWLDLVSQRRDLVRPA